MNNMIIDDYASILNPSQGFNPSQSTNSAADGGEPKVDSLTSEKSNKTTECQTCKNRKYQDGSNEMVSFKTAQNIAPGAVASRVRSHEQEHVTNAFNKAEQKGGKVIQASVRLTTAICPECGRAYVSGGETTTKICYSNPDNPYSKNTKASQALATKGNNVDLAG